MSRCNQCREECLVCHPQEDESELTSLRQRLKEAEEVIGFYANKESWIYDKSTGIGGLVKAGDEWTDIPSAGAACFYPSYGGKRAREYLAKYAKEER